MFKKAKFFLLSLIVVFSSSAGFAAPDESKIPEVFRGERKGSPIQINYDDWNKILHSTVVEAGMSDRSSASAPQAETGTRVVRGNTSSTRNEGARIVFPAFADEKNAAIVLKIRQELEAVPGEVPMREWTKNEQLAYWLNLYNITLIDLIAKEYPTRSVKNLTKGKDSIWAKKVLNVAGVPLSLNDIEDILIKKWDSTLVMYGLFQGYVGGPSIRRNAYTGANVHKELVDNAKEFVNSNRGMRTKGSTLQISEYYEQFKPLFPDWKEDLKKHFISLTDYGLHGRIQGAKKIKASTSDYYIADLFGGSTRHGTAMATNPAALNDARVHVSSGQSAGNASMGIGSFTMESYADFGKASIDMRFPPHVREYIFQMRKNKSTQDGNVEVEELEEGSSEDPSQQ
ncbi:DUF547 domain-containing protein [Kordiimonas gwangyangensis]|uniref:DUF547 domain-containing protein n=1 Tax=Kordiimonas gwangyangensis TaxID=288022 RepID=UPI00035D1774|nr:DUF547 domain-containing protein [Kordiimonas gwangyangensis]